MVNAELVSCRDLSCGYPGKVVVEGVDLTVQAGQIVTILGRSGSGKSTLLKTMAGLLQPLGGSVRLLGRDRPWGLSGAEQRKLYRRIGMLYQGDALLGSLTIFENTALPLRELTDLPAVVIEFAARSRLALVDVLETEQRTPSQISGGQSKRAGLARATILDPPLLFCDEPTSALDPLAAGQIDTLLLRLRDAFQMAIVAVTHDSATVRNISDVVVALAQGRVRAAGSVSDIERELPSFFQRSSRPRGGLERKRRDDEEGR